MTTPTGAIVSDELQATAPVAPALRYAVAAIAVAMSLYHMYVAAFGPPEAVIFRGTHLLFALTLVFLLYPTRPSGSPAWRILDALLLAAGWGFVLHIFVTYDAFVNRIIYIDDLTAWDRIFAVVAVLIVLVATRRVIGWALPLTAIAFLVYATLFTRVTLDVLLEQLYLSTEGIFGSTLGVSASYVMLFVLFGAFMERSGTGPAVHGFRAFDHRPHGRRSRQGRGCVVQPVRHGVRQRGRERDGRRADHDPADEAHRLPADVRRGGRGRRVDRGPDHAADHGRRGVRDGGIPRRAVREGGAVGGDPGAPLLRRRVLRRPLRGEAPRSGRRAALGAAAFCARHGATRPSVRADRRRARRTHARLLGAAVRAGGRARVSPGRAAAPTTREGIGWKTGSRR